MKNKRRTITFVIEIIALFAFVFIFIKFSSDKIRPDQIFAYSRNMTQGEKIEESDLISIPISNVTRTTDMVLISDYADIVGKYVAADTFVNNIVYRSQLTDVDETTSIMLQDLSNKVMISIPIDYVEGLAGNLKAGDKIDLMYTGSGSVSDGENDNEFTYSKVFLRDIQVYNINTGDGYQFVDHSTIFEAEVETASETNNMLELTSSEPASITLILTPSQAEQLAARRATGTVKILKRFDETQTHETLGFVIGNYGKVFTGNANAETANLQVVDSYTDDDPNKRDSVNTNKGNVSGGTETETGSDGSPSSGRNSGQNPSQISGVVTGTTAVG